MRRQPQPSATISVCDNGPGVPEDKLNSIFETFYTTKQEGSGLGLSIARTSSRSTAEGFGPRINAVEVLCFISRCL